MTRDPVDPDVNVLTGEVRSQGLDISATGKIGERTRMVAYLGWIDAKVTKDSDPNRPSGTRLQNAPKRRLHFMVMHELSGILQDVEVGAAMQYVSTSMTSTDINAWHLSSYTTVDLMANYQISQNAKLRLSLKNMFDRVYYTRNHGVSGVPGEPRTFYASLEYRL